MRADHQMKRNEVARLRQERTTKSLRGLHRTTFGPSVSLEHEVYCWLNARSWARSIGYPLFLKEWEHKAHIHDRRKELRKASPPNEPFLRIEVNT